MDTGWRYNSDSYSYKRNTTEQAKLGLAPGSERHLDHGDLREATQLALSKNDRGSNIGIAPPYLTETIQL